jgi:hypothetical protein
MLESYTGNADAVAFMAGWFAVCLLGRILAVLAAAVSVTLEIAAYGLAMIAAGFADAGQRASAQVLDQAGAGLNLMLAGGLGVAVLCSVYCTWRARVFPVALNVVGLVGGVAAVGAQLTVLPSWQTLNDVLYIAPLLFWVWMIWAGVLLWRRTPAHAGARPPARLSRRSARRTAPVRDSGACGGRNVTEIAPGRPRRARPGARRPRLVWIGDRHEPLGRPPGRWLPPAHQDR